LTTSAARTPAASQEAIFSSTSAAVSEGDRVSATKSGQIVFGHQQFGRHVICSERAA